MKTQYYTATSINGYIAEVKAVAIPVGQGPARPTGKFFEIRSIILSMPP